MRGYKERDTEKLHTAENPEYLRGYRDGVRDRRSAARPVSGDGLLGALLAITLIAGIGYFAYNYATTGRVMPTAIDTNILSPGSNPP